MSNEEVVGDGDSPQVSERVQVSPTITLVSQLEVRAQ